jgi:hypothetical protein
MNRVAGAFLRIDNEYIGLHEKLLSPGRKLPEVMSASLMLWNGLCARDTDLTHIDLFNPVPQCSELAKHPEVPIYSFLT